MKRAIIRGFLAVSVVGMGFVTPAHVAYGQMTPEQQGCAPSSEAIEYDLPNVDASGAANDVQLTFSTQKAAFNFTVPPGPTQALTVYVGDQWYDLDLALYKRGSCVASYAWQVRVAAISQRAERRVMQFMRPDEQVLKSVEPGDYRLVVAHKWHTIPGMTGDFDPSRGFTVRIARTAEMCALTPDNTAPHPALSDPETPQEYKDRLADVRVRPDDALYQLGATIGPADPDQFALMSFNAVISPPYTDLFDFEWFLDGKRVGEASPTMLMAASALDKPDGALEHTHELRLVAKGAREYQDPTDPQYNHLPLNGGTLELACTFTIVEKR